jgi:hypothetical protein
MRKDYEIVSFFEKLVQKNKICLKVSRNTNQWELFNSPTVKYFFHK